MNGHVDGISSRLLGAAWRAMAALGARRLVSYTRVDETGACYRAAGWVACALSDGRAHDTGNRAQRWIPGLYEPTSEIIDHVRLEIGPDALTTRVDLIDGAWINRPGPDPGSTSAASST